MNRHSIFFKLNLLFGLALLMLLLLFGFFRFNTALHEHRLESQRGMELMRLLHHTKAASASQRAEQLEEAQFELLPAGSLPTAAKLLPAPRKEPRHRAPFALYIDDDTYYFKSLIPHDDFLVKDSRKADTFAGLHLIFLLLLAGLTALYVTLRRSLLPLKGLTQEIRRFARGDNGVDTASTRRDEIGTIANEFNDAVKTIVQLQSSRQLFLRNIMHELKTPLTKGKLTLAMMEPGEEVRYLDTLLNRMDSLINQFARIEKLQSGNRQKERRKIYALIQEAITNLYLDNAQKSRIEINAQREVQIDVDSELFVSALSNLLDNALKYTADKTVKVTIEPTQICISNRADTLPQPIEAYLQPFISEHHSDGGTGLGLYIVDTVVSAHGFTLDYRYEHGIHTFCIRFI
ncbi:ArsS family sensor histidine kinase [Sulfurimonas sp. HSL3-7]|uniref:ArsS family sensor histidine kinase n=1 Tax=Sulfonitrofixus jiaomeiensis TaxID=3131938 RepID=UPI0031F9F724